MGDGMVCHPNSVHGMWCINALVANVNPCARQDSLSRLMRNASRDERDIERFFAEMRVISLRREFLAVAAVGIEFHANTRRSGDDVSCSQDEELSCVLFLSAGDD